MIRRLTLSAAQWRRLLVAACAGAGLLLGSVLPGVAATSLGVNLTTDGNISTTGSGAITSAGALTASAGLSVAGTTTFAGGTVTASNPILDTTQTWNNSGVTFTALKLNVTDTASAASSILLDLQTGGTSKFKVDKTGAVTVGGNLTAGGLISTSLNSGGAITITSGGTGNAIFQTPGTNSANSGGVIILSGNVTGSPANSGAITIDTGSATGNPGNITIGGGNAGTVSIGKSSSSVVFPGGSILTTGLSSMTMKSADTNAGSANSGSVTVSSGNAAGATSNSGSLIFVTGSSTLNSGSITIDSGTASGTGGSISIGTTNASSLTIGKSSSTMTIPSVVMMTSSLTVGGLLTMQSGKSLTMTIPPNHGNTKTLEDITLTTPTSSSGTNVQQGLGITTTIGNATGGTNNVNLINLAPLTGDAEVVLNGIKIGNLSGTGAVESAIYIGSGWDSVLNLNGSTFLDMTELATLDGASGTLVGTTSAQTLTNKTLTSPKIVTSILDTNSALILGLVPASTAVNYLSLANAATGNSPSLTVLGSDTNIGLGFITKGTGSVLIGNDHANVDALQIKPQTTGGSTNVTGVITSADLTSNTTWTLPNATGVVVIDSAAQTLTNKTLTAPFIANAVFPKSTSYTITAAESGSIFTTVGTSGTLTFTLPVKALGLHFTFINTASGISLAIDPNGSDKIAGLTDANGDSILSDTVNESITLVSDGNGWYVTSCFINGTVGTAYSCQGTPPVGWSDNN